jgi:methyl coenzyme M reductase subunit D
MAEQESVDLEELQKQIQAAIKNVISLKITTIVGNVMQEDLTTPPTVTDSKTMHTEIDLLQGDLVSMIDQRLLADEFAIIRQHHEKREEQAHEIIDGNIKALGKLAALVQEMLDERAGDSS